MSDILINGNTYEDVETISVNTTSGEIATYSEDYKLYNHFIQISSTASNCKIHLSIVSSLETAVTSNKDIVDMIMNGSSVSEVFLPASGVAFPSGQLQIVSSIHTNGTELQYIYYYAVNSMSINSILSPTITDVVVQI